VLPRAQGIGVVAVVIIYFAVNICYASTIHSSANLSKFEAAWRADKHCRHSLFPRAGCSRLEASM